MRHISDATSAVLVEQLLDEPMDLVRIGRVLAGVSGAIRGIAQALEDDLNDPRRVKLSAGMLLNQSLRITEINEHLHKIEAEQYAAKHGL